MELEERCEGLRKVNSEMERTCRGLIEAVSRVAEMMASECLKAREFTKPLEEMEGREGYE